MVIRENCRNIEKLDNCVIGGKITETVEENCRNIKKLDNGKFEER